VRERSGHLQQELSRENDPSFRHHSDLSGVGLQGADPEAGQEVQRRFQARTDEETAVGREGRRRRG
jgi:hypothetical protein